MTLHAYNPRSFLFPYRVKNWALKFGVDLWEFGRQVTKMNEIQRVRHGLGSGKKRCRYRYSGTQENGIENNAQLIAIQFSEISSENAIFLSFLLQVLSPCADLKPRE